MIAIINRTSRQGHKGTGMAIILDPLGREPEEIFAERDLAEEESMADFESEQ